MKRCRVVISVYFAVIMACILVLDQTGLAGLALICAALHETGHFIALRAFRAPIEEINFKTFGVSIKLSKNCRLDYRQEIIVALAGCVSNLIFCLMACLFCEAGILILQMQAMAVMNLCLCVFNLLPIGPLDGGRALEAALCAKVQPNTARRVVTAVSVVFTVPLAFLGVYILLVSGYNFSLLLAAAYLGVCLAMKGKLLEIA